MGGIVQVVVNLEGCPGQAQVLPSIFPSPGLGTPLASFPLRHLLRLPSLMNQIPTHTHIHILFFHGLRIL